MVYVYTFKGCMAAHVGLSVHGSTGGYVVCVCMRASHGHPIG